MENRKLSLFEAASVVAGLSSGGGCRADFIIFDAHTILDLVRLSPARLKVVKSGRVVAETTPERGRIHYEKESKAVDFRSDAE